MTALISEIEKHGGTTNSGGEVVELLGAVMFVTLEVAETEIVADADATSVDDMLVIEAVELDTGVDKTLIDEVVLGDEADVVALTCTDEDGSVVNGPILLVVFITADDVGSVAFT
jgi:hypothetical protein